MWIKRIKLFIQRGKYGYNSEDTGVLSLYLCKWLPSALRKIRERTEGHPGKFKSTREWKNTIKKVERGFSAGHSLLTVDYLGDERPEVWKPRKKKLERQFDEGMRLFHKHFFNL